MRFRKKPVVIDAIRWTGFNEADVAVFLEGHTSLRGGVQTMEPIIITTLEGNHRAEVGDWIIKGIKDEFYPIKNGIFLLTYSRVYRDLKRRSRLTEGG